MPRAKVFFSYSRSDAEVVEAVASGLSRPLLNIDSRTFKDGEGLADAIDRTLDESAVFVLFASRNSLRSDWVEHEVSQARIRMIAGRVKRPLVAVIDRTLDHSELPSWMTGWKTITEIHPAALSRAIATVVDDVLLDHQAAFFVDRRAETERLEDAFTYTDAPGTAGVVMLTGLTGIGRRTILRRVARDSLSMSRLLELRVESGDSINDLALKLADLAEAPGSRTLKEMIQDIRRLIDEEALVNVLRNIDKTLTRRELPVLVDAGGIFDHDGRVTQPIARLVQEVSRVRDPALAIVSNRRPRRPDDDPGLGHEPLRTVTVNALPLQAIVKLLTWHGRKAGIELTDTQVRLLARNINGYAPSVPLVIELVRAYGPDLVVNRPNLAISHRTSIFTHYLRSLDVQGTRRNLLRILGASSPLPLASLTRLAAAPQDDVEEQLMALIDTSVVVPVGVSSLYALSDPLVGSVDRVVYPSLTQDEYKGIDEELEAYIAGIELRDHNAKLELQRVRLRAAVLAGRKDFNYLAELLVADWIRLSQSLYGERMYSQAAATAESAVEARPDNVDARIQFIKALVKNDQFDEARQQIESLRRRGYIQESYYHEGFLERNRGNTALALRRYKDAEKAGARGVAIHRELAICYVDQGDLEKAQHHIDAALTRDPQNRYVVDLQVKIACQRGDEETARRLLHLLRDIDEPMFYTHRKSRVELAFGNPAQAVTDARTAYSMSKRPPFEVISHLVICEAIVGNSKLARDRLGELRAQYRRRNLDVQVGLECRINITEGRFRDALGLWERLSNKNKLVHLKLRHDAISGLLTNTYVPGEERTELSAELKRISASLDSKWPANAATLLELSEDR